MTVPTDRPDDTTSSATTTSATTTSATTTFPGDFPPRPEAALDLETATQKIFSDYAEAIVTLGDR